MVHVFFWKILCCRVDLYTFKAREKSNSSIGGPSIEILSRTSRFSTSKWFCSLVFIRFTELNPLSHGTELTGRVRIMLISLAISGNISECSCKNVVANLSKPKFWKLRITNGRNSRYSLLSLAASRAGGEGSHPGETWKDLQKCWTNMSSSSSPNLPSAAFETEVG